MSTRIPRVHVAGGSPRERSGSAGVLSLIESAYAVDLPYRSWAKGLLGSMQDILACDLGGFMCFWECQEGGQPCLAVNSPVAVGVAKKHAPLIFGGLASAPSDWLTRTLESLRGIGQCTLSSELDPSGKLSYRSRLQADGVADGVNLVACDLNQRGFLISLGVTRRHRLTVARRRDLTRAVTHILAALRLRVRLATVGPVEPEAVLSPDGRLLHAHGTASLASARRALEGAVRTIERARSGPFDPPDDALASWKGLVAARWSLVDRFERDGTRYVIARENRPRTTGLSGLTQTECNAVAYIARGLSTKETAYALGISPATVRVLVMRAARRCGVKNRRELVDTWTRRTTASAPRNP